MKIVASFCVSPSERSYKHSPTGSKRTEIIAYALTHKVYAGYGKNKISNY